MIAAASPFRESPLKVFKDTHRVKDLAEFHTRPPGTVGVGHTRWATHGGVTRENAHPHMDCSNDIAVVHNGIIDNYREFGTSLRRKGMPSLRKPTLK